MIIEDIIEKHPSYERLLRVISLATHIRTLIIPKIEIKGIPFSLQEKLIAVLEKEFKQNIQYSSRDSMEIRKYFQTTQLIDITQLSRIELIKILTNHDFTKTPKIFDLGQFTTIGDIITFWPIGKEHPIKVSYFGDEYETSYVYDEIYGSKYDISTTTIIGDLATLETKTSKSQLFESMKATETMPLNILFGGDMFDTYESKGQVAFDFNYPQLYFQRFDILEDEIKHKINQGHTIILNTKHTDKVPDSLKKYLLSDLMDLEAGFVSNQGKIMLLTDRELYGTVFLNKETNKLSSDRARKLLSELEGEIEVGDYVVHEDHGIGIYAGLKQEKYEQKVPAGFGKYIVNIIYEDYILIKYAEGDELYVPLSQLNKITKYIGTDSDEPRLTRLGKNEWANFKRKVKESIAIYAKELVADYAQREIATAPVINPEEDEYYKEFVDAFEYSETPDQIRSEKEILKDLSSENPMNRIIVGDVGFGKTEMAMRAAFKVVQTGKQVAVLCPTTVLAAQHEKVFMERFAAFPFKVSSVSRFNTKSHKKIVEELKEGKIDIIIGTHRLLSNDIQFKDLGLVVIDEEQKFGVKQKERLKKLKYGVHVLAMSATPIPRTLSMALSSIWDISLIQTPPEGRKSIQTIVSKMNWQDVANSIEQEVSRGGQVYFVHNRVRSIVSTFTRLQGLLPQVKFVYAHGQMETSKLEKAIADFYNKEFDCLVCTTIIENGIDMQNVNTIIIQNAQNFGLGQLHQLRGRVGRGDKQAYAYIFYDGEDIDKENADYMVTDTEDPEKQIIIKARQKKYKERLKALQEAEELGSGFKIASRDLEIRGAGNLLGKQQHGNINYIGYGLYMQLLAEEIERLKNIKTLATK
jgi:transcription-repair coupling factor (superfamily II helicase)